MRLCLMIPPLQEQLVVGRIVVWMMGGEELFELLRGGEGRLLLLLLPRLRRRWEDEGDLGLGPQRHC